MTGIAKGWGITEEAGMEGSGMLEALRGEEGRKGAVGVASAASTSARLCAFFLSLLWLGAFSVDMALAKGGGAVHGPASISAHEDAEIRCAGSISNLNVLGVEDRSFRVKRRICCITISNNSVKERP